MFSHLKFGPPHQFYFFKSLQVGIYRRKTIFKSLLTLQRLSKTINDIGLKFLEMINLPFSGAPRSKEYPASLLVVSGRKFEKFSFSTFLYFKYFSLKFLQLIVILSLIQNL